MIWNNSTYELLHSTAHRADMDEPCVVLIDGERIVVEYEEDGLRRYVGTNDGSGHFELNMEGGSGRATLHRFPESSLLEGSWIEGSESGMWRIHLG